jgi:hypothetical protein
MQSTTSQNGNGGIRFSLAAIELTAPPNEVARTEAVHVRHGTVNSTDELFGLLQQAKLLAKRYRALTGRPLGISGEIAECEAVRLLGLELAPVRTAGYDALRRLPDGTKQRLQVKGRVLHSRKLVGRMGSIDITKEWDAVLLVLLDDDYDTIKIVEAPRAAVVAAIQRPGSRARNERGALSISLFCSARIGRQVWPDA